MGILERPASGEITVLRSRFLVGRSATCDLRIDDPRVSGEHASLRWTGTVWKVRDLASKNGTFLGERRLTAGERVPLVAGDTLALGGAGPPAPVLVLRDAAPPPASARHATSGAVRPASGGLIVLPDDEQPEVSILEGSDGRWVVEAEGTARLPSDGEVLVVRGERWILDLPEGSSSTLEDGPGAPSLADIALRFLVSRDEERVDVTVLLPDREIQLPSRSYYYLLVTLARARLRDAETPPAERGFLDRDALCRMLATDELRLNVDVCRIRKQFASLGVRGAAQIVDRRAGTGRLRLGVDRVDVQRAP